jgi:hypothetical protein
MKQRKNQVVTDKDLTRRVHHPAYGVIVICTNEENQERIYNALKQKYPQYKIKVVCV